jgi:hypothetical protein
MLPAIICGVLGRPLTGLEKAIIDNNFIINKAMETKFKRKKNVIVRTRGLYLLIRLLAKIRKQSTDSPNSFEK